MPAQGVPAPAARSRAGLWWGLGIAGFVMLMLIGMIVLAVAIPVLSGSAGGGQNAAGSRPPGGDVSATGLRCGSTRDAAPADAPPLPSRAEFDQGAEKLIGTAAPPLSGIECHSGNRTTLVDAKGTGKPTLVVFWANWCPHCQREMPIVAQLAARHASDWNVVTVSVASSRTPTQTPAKFASPEAFISTVGLNMPTIVDPGDYHSAVWRVDGFPMMYFVSPDGIIRDVASGESPAEVIEARVDAVRN